MGFSWLLLSSSFLKIMTILNLYLVYILLSGSWFRKGLCVLSCSLVVLVSYFPHCFCVDVAFCSFCHQVESSTVLGFCTVLRKILPTVTLFSNPFLWLVFFVSFPWLPFLDFWDWQWFLRIPLPSWNYTWRCLWHCMGSYIFPFSESLSVEAYCWKIWKLNLRFLVYLIL